MKKSFIRLLLITTILSAFYSVNATDHFWVHKTVYQNFFATPSELSDWQLIEDNGSGGLALSGNGTIILTMDNAAGGYANRVFNVNGAAARLLPFDFSNGRVELFVKAITGGNQRIFLQAQEFDGSSNYLGQVNILPAQSATGFFSVDLNTITWDPSTVQVRYIIGGENYSGQQGTVEFGFFSYSNTNNNFSNPANWSLSSGGAGGVAAPTATDNAIFDGSNNSNGSCLVDMNVSINGIQITTAYSGNIDLKNSQLTIGPGGINAGGGGITGNALDIQINGNLTFSGGSFKNTSGSTFISGDINITGGGIDLTQGSIVFNASTDQQFSNSSTIPINNITINKSSGSVTLNSDIVISGSLTLTQGIINTGSNAVKLGINNTYPGILVSGNGKVNGYLSRWIAPTSSGALIFPFGNTSSNAPLTIGISAAPSAGGTIKAFYTDATPGFNAVSFTDNSTNIIKKSTAFWTIQTTNITNGNYNMSVSNDHLAAISNLAELHLTLSNAVVGTHQSATGTLSNPVLNRTGLNAIDLANIFFVSSSSALLPVTWDKFNITRNADKFTWSWHLSTEENTAGYSPQYSANGADFINAGAINSLHADHSYAFTAPLPISGNIFFRIREEDKDGKLSYSAVRMINVPVKIDFSVFPNPVKDVLNIKWPDERAVIILTTIYDATGIVVSEHKNVFAPFIKISVTDLPHGLYYISCVDEKKQFYSSSLMLK